MRTPDKSKQCDGKERFLSLQDARISAISLMGKESKKKRIGAYKCEFCNHFHIGHNSRTPPPKERRKKKPTPNDYVFKYKNWGEGASLLRVNN